MNSIRLNVAALGLIASLSASAGVVGFTGTFAPGTWTTTIVGTVEGGGTANGSINTGGAPSSITLNGGDDPSGVGCLPGFLLCEIQFTHATLGEPSMAFHWSYTSNDSAGAQLDSFGVILDGSDQQLSDSGGLAAQQGSASFSPASSFGFYINCGDCVGGNAVVTITDFRTTALQVPEPSSLALVGLGVLCAGALRRTHRA